ncbi:MAG: OsmC family protein [Flavobacteriaceae bacterium]
MENTHQYEVNLQWNSERKGTLSSPVLPSKIEVATPPDFPKGMPGIWSPEHLFVAAVNSCVMTTFLAIAENSKVEFISFECNAIGKVEQVEGKYMVTQIILKPTLVVPSTANEERMHRILEKSEKACLISNSIKSEILFQPSVILA